MRSSVILHAPISAPLHKHSELFCACSAHRPAVVAEHNTCNFPQNPFWPLCRQHTLIAMCCRSHLVLDAPGLCSILCGILDDQHYRAGTCSSAVVSSMQNSMTCHATCCCSLHNWQCCTPSVTVVYSGTCSPKAQPVAVQLWKGKLEMSQAQTKALYEL